MRSEYGATGLNVSYSVFVDIRLLSRTLVGLPLPFNDNISYIFKKQIEEGDIIVINKADLLPKKAADILTQAQHQFPEKLFLLQNSLSNEGVLP